MPLINSFEFDIEDFNYWSSALNEKKYEPEVLTRAQARRMNPLIKIAVDLALKTTADHSFDYIIHSSRHGELHTSNHLIHSILDGETPSPMKFSQSTHNSLPGAYSIISGQKAPISSISSGESSFVSGILNAISYLLDSKDKKKVLYIFSDAKLPEEYERKLSVKTETTVVAMILTLGGKYQGAFSSNPPKSRTDCLPELAFIDWMNLKERKDKFKMNGLELI